LFFFFFFQVEMSEGIMDFHYHHYFQTSIIRHPSQDKKQSLCKPLSKEDNNTIRGQKTQPLNEERKGKQNRNYQENL